MPNLLNSKSRNHNKHEKCTKRAIPTHQRHAIEEEAGATLRPNLHSNKYFSKIMGRYSNGNIFSNLYGDHLRMNYKKALYRQEEEKAIDEMHNSQEKFVSKKVTRKLLKNYIPFYERYDQELEKTATRVSSTIYGN